MVAKCLAYDDNFTFPAAASTLPPEGVPEGLAAPEDDLATLLELPDPDPDVAGDASSSTVISAAPDDAVVASADSGLTEVGIPIHLNLSCFSSSGWCLKLGSSRWDFACGSVLGGFSLEFECHWSSVSVLPAHINLSCFSSFG